MSGSSGDFTAGAAFGWKIKRFGACCGASLLWLAISFLFYLYYLRDSLGTEFWELGIIEKECSGNALIK
jgi:hypothetical protein